MRDRNASAREPKRVGVNKTRKVIIGLLLLVGVILVAAALTLTLLVPRLKGEIVSAIADRTNLHVEIAELGWSIWPTLRLQGKKLEIGNPEERQSTFFQVGSFSLRAGFFDLISEPRQIESLEIREVRATIAPRKPGGPSSASVPSKTQVPAVSIGTILASDIRIEMLSAEAEKESRVFQIDRLEFESFDLRRPIAFKALIAYVRPRGPLEVQGQFGPLDAAAPRLTPYQGNFSLPDADLSVFGGISGHLVAAGSFQGTLQDTQARGTAEIADFAITRVGRIVPLRNRFEVAVRDNAGLIELIQVETSFLNSRLITTGTISGIAGNGGRKIELHVRSEVARVEDLVQFGVSSPEPPLTGNIELETDVRIYPGSSEFGRPLQVEGNFLVREGRFSNINIQATLEKISRIGRDEVAAEEGGSVVSDLRGRFHLENGEITFSVLEFSVPGMQVDLVGSYKMDGELLDFQGRLALEKTPSELASGKLSDWIRILDPILRRGKQGTVVPISIQGTRSDPRFSVDFSRLLK